jgi:hypothetical protein
MPRKKIEPLTKKQWKAIFSNFTLKEKKLLLDDFKWRLEVLS